MLNETNITIDAARVMINSQTGTNDSLALISQILIPAIAIIVTGVTSVLITYYTVINNTRSIYIQANQTEIKKAMEELSKRVNRGQAQEIIDFLNSIEGIYIPKSMRNRIRKKCSENWLIAFLPNWLKAFLSNRLKAFLPNWLIAFLQKRKVERSKEQKIKIIDEINKYISP